MNGEMFFLPCKQSCQDKAVHTGRPCRPRGTLCTSGKPEHRSPARSPKGDAQCHRQQKTYETAPLKDTINRLPTS